MVYTQSFLYRTNAALLVGMLFIGMIILAWLGNLAGKRRAEIDKQKEKAENTTVLGAVFGLFAFLLAFTFSMSGNRYEVRRLNSVAEANAIGTAILRADLYPTDVRIALREDFKAYLQARIDYHYSGADTRKMDSASQMATKMGQMLWSRAVSDAKNASSLFLAT